MNLLNLTPKSVELQNGIVLNYVRAGAGPTVILIHGAMGDYRAWQPQWDLFTRHFDCISYSRRYSSPNPNELTTRDHNALVDAEDLDGLMIALEINEAVLVGSSYGGFTALAMALRKPQKVQGVVSVEAPMMRYAEQTPKGGEIVKSFKKASANPAQAAFEAGDDLGGVMILTGGIVGRNPAEIPDHIVKRRMENARAARSLAISKDEFPWLDPDALSALPMPIMLLSGADTAPIHAAIFSEVCKAIPQARSVVVAGSGHSVSQMRPDVFNSEVLAFIDGLPASDQTAAE